MTKGVTALLANTSTKTTSVPVLPAPSNPPTRVVKATAPPEVVKATPPAPKPADLEVTPVGEDLVIRPARDVTGTPGSKPLPESSNTSTTGTSATAAKAGSTNEKRGFLSGLNPFRARPKTTTSTNEGPAVESSTASNAEGVSDFPRYAYVSPARPAAGKRSGGGTILHGRAEDAASE